MGGNGRNCDLPGKADNKSTPAPPVPVQDDEGEDGDFATPKRDRHDEDDQPL